MRILYQSSETDDVTITYAPKGVLPDPVANVMPAAKRANTVPSLGEFNHTER